MVDELIDQKAIATEVVLEAIKHLLPAGERVIKSTWSRLRGRELELYANYLLNKSIQAKSVRNFIYDQKGASLYDIYVPTMITTDVMAGDDLIVQLCRSNKDPTERPSKAIAIIGNAGVGKSLFMKDVFFKIQNLPEKRIPILIEVRSFNRRAMGDLVDRIIDEFGSFDILVTREQLIAGLKGGIFALLLDGMDELKNRIQRHYEEELISFAAKYPCCPILVSSRPAQRINSWSPFEIRRIAPLTLSSAIDLIERLEFKLGVKESFVKLLKVRLFSTHYEFVSVPLLCTIMLLTFSDSGFISSNRHEFFEDAFSALWSKHDGRKDGGHDRQRRTGLQKNDFSKLLSCFAFSSYRTGDYDMRESHFSRHFQEAVNLVGFQCREEDFLEDLTVATSLFVHDGPYIRFCHRSFHEYFSALFLCSVSDDVVAALIEEISDRIETDHVLPLIMSINEEKIEKFWVLQKIREISEFVLLDSTTSSDYALEAASGLEANRPVGAIMKKLRLLYNLNPTSEVLDSAYDAAQDIRRSYGLRSTKNLLPTKAFRLDRENFRQLIPRLEKKYQKRAHALTKMLEDLNKNPSSR